MSAQAIDEAALRAWPLPALEEDGDKESRGRVLVVAGSREMPGAAILAGRGIGMWKSAAAMEAVRRPDRIFKPRMKPEVRQGHYEGWRRAVAAARAFGSAA